MRITRDLRANEILRLEHLLEGFNYSVWVNTYGPFDLNRTREEQLAHSTSNEVIVGGQSCVTTSEARSEVTKQLLHVGDGGYGPLELNAKRSEILNLLEDLFMHVQLDQPALPRRRTAGTVQPAKHPSASIKAGAVFELAYKPMRPA